MIGKPLLHLSVVSSTNDVAKELAEQGCSEGTAILADFQTLGRGRLGRRWHAPARSGLLLSVVFRPSLPPGAILQLTMLCGLAVVDAVRRDVGLEVGLKWPNDVVCNGRKLGGILAETAFAGGRVEYSVVGLGLNVQAVPLGQELGMPATSLSEETGRPVPLGPLLECVLAALEARYAALRRGWSPYGEWTANLVTLGHEVVVSGGDGQWAGIACGVEPGGALLVRLADGRVERVTAEDVTLQRRPGWHQPGRSDTIAQECTSE